VFLKDLCYSSRLLEAKNCTNNNVKGILADDMYDSNNNLRYLSKNHIKPGIKTRSTSKIGANPRG